MGPWVARVLGFPAGKFQLPRPFRSRVKFRQGTDRQTDGQRGHHCVMPTPHEGERIIKDFLCKFLLLKIHSPVVWYAYFSGYHSRYGRILHRVFHRQTFVDWRCDLWDFVQNNCPSCHPTNSIKTLQKYATICQCALTAKEGKERCWTRLSCHQKLLKETFYLPWLLAHTHWQIVANSCSALKEYATICQRAFSG